MYEVILTRKTQKFYQQANVPLAKKLNKCFENLTENPYRHPNIKSLTGRLKGRWRYRVGNFRVIYKIDESEKLVTILLIASRGNIYEQ